MADPRGPGATFGRNATRDRTETSGDTSGGGTSGGGGSSSSGGGASSGGSGGGDTSGGWELFDAAGWRRIVAAYGLTPRELDILRQVFRGHPETRIAWHLKISRHTVHTHKKNIFGKVDVRDTAGLILRLVREFYPPEGMERREPRS